MQKIQDDWVRKLSVAPFPLRTLLSELKGYSQPLFKVHQLVKSGVLYRLKRGFYCVNPEYSGKLIDTRVIANSLYDTPSCISLEYALSFYGLIPEYVPGITSVVNGRSKLYETPVGWFSYKKVPEKLFSIGIRSQNGYLIASPEKALCDYVLTRRDLRISSPKTMQSYLEEDVRFDFDEFEGYDPSVFREYAESGIKPDLFSALARLFK